MRRKTALTVLGGITAVAASLLLSVACTQADTYSDGASVPDSTPLTTIAESTPQTTAESKAESVLDTTTVSKTDSTAETATSASTAETTSVSKHESTEATTAESKPESTTEATTSAVTEQVVTESTKVTTAASKSESTSDTITITAKSESTSTAQASSQTTAGKKQDSAPKPISTEKPQNNDTSTTKAQTTSAKPQTTTAAPVAAAPDNGKTTQVSGKVTTSAKVKIPDEISQLLLNYYKERYESTGSLNYRSLGGYFNTDNIYGRLYSGFSDTTLEYLIYARQCHDADLSYDKASFTVNVEKSQVESGVYKIKYTLSESLSFVICSVQSKSCGKEIDAEISKGSDGSYRFDVLAEDTDVNILVEECVMNYIGYDYDKYYLKDMYVPDTLDTEKMYSSILKTLKAQAESNVAKQKKMLSAYNKKPYKYKSSITAQHTYNRAKALSYAYSWANGEKVVRNPKYSDYSIYGGNCQNYVSQVIFATGVPMDWTGKRQWKWFDDNINLNEEPKGRTGSWSGTEYFYNYCKKNTGKGLVAELGANIFSAQPGDVIQYVVNGWAHHSVIVTDVVHDKNGNVVDLLINSNTTDRVNFPMSAYGYTDIRLIKIIGYNK